MGSKSKPKAKPKPQPSPRYEDEDEESDFDSYSFGDRKKRAHLGPNVRKALRKFPGYEGEMPPAEAEELWTADDLHNFFYTGGFIRPKITKKKKGPPPVPKTVL